MRAATSGSLGTSKGSWSMTTSDSASPGTSTPCQNEVVPSSTASGVVAEASTSAALLPSPLHEQRPAPVGGQARRGRAAAARSDVKSRNARPVRDLEQRPRSPRRRARRRTRVGRARASAAAGRARPARAWSNGRARRSTARLPVEAEALARRSRSCRPTASVAEVSTHACSRSNSVSRSSSRDVDRARPTARRCRAPAPPCRRRTPGSSPSQHARAALRRAPRPGARAPRRARPARRARPGRPTSSSASESARPLRLEVRASALARLEAHCRPALRERLARAAGRIARAASRSTRRPAAARAPGRPASRGQPLGVARQLLELRRGDLHAEVQRSRSPRSGAPRRRSPCRSRAAPRRTRVRTARSAKNRWWLTTTICAACAARFIRVSQQRLVLRAARAGAGVGARVDVAPQARGVGKVGQLGAVAARRRRGSTRRASDPGRARPATSSSGSRSNCAKR